MLSLHTLTDRVVRPATATRAEPKGTSRQLYQDLLLRQTEMTRRLQGGGYL